MSAGRRESRGARTARQVKRICNIEALVEPINRHQHRVAIFVYETQFAGLPQRHQRRQRGMQTEAPVQFQRAAFGAGPCQRD